MSSEKICDICFQAYVFRRWDLDDKKHKSRTWKKKNHLHQNIALNRLYFAIVTPHKMQKMYLYEWKFKLKSFVFILVNVIYNFIVHY